MDYHKTKVNNKHSGLKHILHMILCCGFPMVIIGFLPLITKLNPSAGATIAKILPFLCPVMMFLMVTMMIRNNKKSSCCESKYND
ncbi:hypothetical protein SAMN02745163_02847 [Clostridium cavendishii DSM 21758]|uniref:DUF2933 domain-containing protein n=1 Tax=Clostridium cavendishii DSM 21758 TaxID=1121302 RepID=A0A1M6NAR8_9CLOT|nr:hypothetical protein [Clostridium cavendishii]SHJ92788.1 hypothetical protein SAMN02745163_02847 [Clostridium cavendishii DSM 21758]